MRNLTRLVLWDIDLTLVSALGIGVDWYGHALREVAGVELVHLPVFAGRTERAITTQLLEQHGLEATDETIEAMFAAMTAVADEQWHLLPKGGHALPGAAAALAALAEQAGVLQSLVTGNLPALAYYKLTAFELNQHIDFEIGGYGSLSVHRPDLVAAAVASAQRKHGNGYPPESVVVLGDTPHDVDAALAHGATAIGVASGHSSVEELRAAGAHAVLPDLADTNAVVRAVLA
ncbi:haloacid dehalogenase [Longimycelium tulufanense]|uniref:Haloacid dehalogenase n=1 Tax=Longimycelium tulufanense TaxID=907463 RepID=A0A8J3CAD1_9PSEU|nr:haloacid dehalogenase-like hydrolase [Longimycelium tulufanense]GGM38637.1 haloacid dehalogenase [Longimycelium tulufanense]